MNNEMRIPICLAVFQISPGHMRHVNTTQLFKGNNIKTFTVVTLTYREV